MRGVKGLFFAWLRRQHPELLSTYADLYAHGLRTPVITATSSGHG
jgi:hypothetical protein